MSQPTVCLNCGKPFNVYPSEIKKGGGKYCSRKCYYEYVSKTDARSNKNSNLWKGGKTECICKQCGSKYAVYPSQIKYHGTGFCSRKCRVSYFKAGNHWAFNNYSSRKPYCAKWTTEFRSNVRAFFKHICVECKKTQEENGELLCVHHVNYDKESLCKEGELIKDRKFVTLCRSCHGKTIPKSRHEYYNKKYSDLIDNEYNGLCYFCGEENVNQETH